MGTHTPDDRRNAPPGVDGRALRARVRPPGRRVLGAALLAALTSSACQLRCIPERPSPEAALVERGEVLFFTETFAGNGRTCGTCHPAENNFTIDPAFIATLPADDPLFVAEFTPALARNFENPRLMREFGLILENQDGFADLANDFNLRGVPHVLAQRISVASPLGPRTGWSGERARAALVEAPPPAG